MDLIGRSIRALRVGFCFFRLDVLSLVCMVDCSVIIEERFFFLARLVVPGSSSR